MAETIRTLHVEEFDDFLWFLGRCYGLSRDFFTRTCPHIYRPDHEACTCFYVLEHNGKVVSHVGVYPIDIVAAGVSLRIGGVGGVATLPEERGRGYMSKLLNHVIGVMREQGHPVSGLRGDRQRYGMFGWGSAGLIYHLDLSRRSLDWNRVEPVHIEETNPDETLKVVERFHTHPVCHTHRPNLALQLRRQGLRIWVAEDGYAIVSGEDRRNLSVVELVSTSGREAGMIYAMLDCTFGDNASWTLSVWEQERLVRLLPCVSRWSAVSDWQYRIISLSGLLTSCRTFMQQRASGLRDFEVSIGIREHDRVDIATIAVRDGSVEITPDRTSQEYLELDPVAAARLFFGGIPGISYDEIPPGLAGLLPVPIHVPELDHV